VHKARIFFVIVLVAVKLLTHTTGASAATAEFTVKALQCNLVVLASDFEDFSVRAHLVGEHTQHEEVVQLTAWAGFYWTSVDTAWGDNVPHDTYTVERLTSPHGTDAVVLPHDGVVCGTTESSEPSEADPPPSRGEGAPMPDEKEPMVAEAAYNIYHFGCNDIGVEVDVNNVPDWWNPETVTLLLEVRNPDNTYQNVHMTQFSLENPGDNFITLEPWDSGVGAHTITGIYWGPHGSDIAGPTVHCE
jgi:hypothetical protein